MTRFSSGDFSGAVADLGVLVPLSAGLILVNGMDAGPLLIGAGALALSAGMYFGIPFPVQPLKALSALAISQGLSPEVIHAAGIEIGVLFVLLSVTGLAGRLARLFTKSVIRSLQLGVGVLLVVTALKLALEPPDVLGLTFGEGWVLPLTGLVAICVGLASRYEWHPAGALLLLVGVVIGWVIAAPDLGPIRFALPSIDTPPPSVFGTAFVLLVIPQVPLTYGNAVVGVSDLAREHFGARANRVTPSAVAFSCGVGNVASALIGGMPMCHGSSGLSAHVRLGAQSRAMNVMLGSGLIVLGLVYAEHIVGLFGVLPVWVLAGFLAYAGIRHALLVLDLRRGHLVLAGVAAAIGVATGNLAYTTAFALAAAHVPQLMPFLTRPRRREVRASVTFEYMGEREEGREEERDDSVPESVPAVESTDDDSSEDKEKQDATVDHVSEQSMNGSDPPAW